MSLIVILEIASFIIALVYRMKVYIFHHMLKVWIGTGFGATLMLFCAKFALLNIND